ncbi:hypothetical protein [Streptomyces benahoarensis]|uniref:Uncharacterized protein n=1 Tax=Streptomyces benahoarensis TaxID=2595054 RepID=A0A553ZEF3_9ACTN|nr:hypothetical protein [Streptomyces benahoarensis]TSB21174.1 hypothetical protein FNJ62_19720 [Streptomyces benahoarensis]TSB39831.1 hypothetical protein FNZ23_15145 [Streptomyces benahoarensis]
MQTQTQTVTHADRPLAWEGFCTGPQVLSGAQLDALATRLLGLGLAGVEAAARTELVPYPAARGAVPAIVLGSATTLKKCYEADVAHLVEGTPPDDFATYNEARAVHLAAPGDLVVGRTEPWRQAVAGSAAEPVEVPELRHYYLTHALLTLAAQSPADAPAAPLARLLRQLRQAPGTIVRLFALDPEARVLLLWLKRTAGLERLRVDANGQEVAERWNRKTTLYPTVEEAAELPPPAAAADPYELLAAEARRTPFTREFGVLLPRLPGYSVTRAGADAAVMRRRVHGAARLLRERYGLPLGCFKPAEALTGSRIRTGVPLDDPAALDALARQAMETEEDYVLEAHTDYLRHSVEGYEFILAPSTHVVAGELAEGGTVQITRGSVWEGSVYVDEETCGRFGIDPEVFRGVRAGMAGLLGAFEGGGRSLGFVKGGVDFAIARIGGRFGDTPVVGMQDLNLSSNGAEYVRAFLAQAREAHGGDRRIYAATKVVRPVRGTDLRRLKAAAEEDAPGRWTRVLTSVSGRWGMVGVAGPCPRQAAEDILALEQRLHTAGLLRTSLRQAPEPCGA